MYREKNDALSNNLRAHYRVVRGSTIHVGSVTRYSTMDRRYEWVTIDAVNSTMMSYASDKGSGTNMPISMSGVFTDQGVAGEDSVGKNVAMRTVIRIETQNRHVVELYFTPPGKREMLATRMVYTRAQ